MNPQPPLSQQILQPHHQHRHRVYDITRDAQEKDCLDNVLHVILVLFHPRSQRTLYKHAQESLNRLSQDARVVLYVVELCYKHQSFVLTSPENPRHLQIRTDSPFLWHYENLVNIGVQRLLPPDWKAVAWISPDIEFENAFWAQQTLQLLNGTFDVVQLFSHCINMNTSEYAIQIFNSAGYYHEKGLVYCGEGVNYWHPGFGWAIRREAYDQIGGLYELAIRGSGENILLFSLLGFGENAVNELHTDGYKKTILDYQNRVKGLEYGQGDGRQLSFGYVPGVLRHYYHPPNNETAWKILVRHQYDPTIHMTKNAEGLLVPSEQCPKELLKDIEKSFY